MSAPTCNEIELHIPDYLAGALAETDRARVEAHLADCPACREAAETLRLLHGAMKEIPLRETLDERRREAVLETFRRRAERPPALSRWAALLELLNPARPPKPALRFAVALLVFVVLPVMMMALLLPAQMSARERASGRGYEELAEAPKAALDIGGYMNEAEVGQSLDRVVENAVAARPTGEDSVGSKVAPATRPPSKEMADLHAMNGRAKDQGLLERPREAAAAARTASSSEKAANETRPAAPEMVPLVTEIPKPMFVGTPVPINVPNLEKPGSGPTAAAIDGGGATRLRQGSGGQAPPRPDDDSRASRLQAAVDAPAHAPPATLAPASSSGVKNRLHKWYDDSVVFGAGGSVASGEPALPAPGAPVGQSLAGKAKEEESSRHRLASQRGDVDGDEKKVDKQAQREVTQYFAYTVDGGAAGALSKSGSGTLTIADPASKPASAAGWGGGTPVVNGTLVVSGDADRRGGQVAGSEGLSSRLEEAGGELPVAERKVAEANSGERLRGRTLGVDDYVAMGAVSARGESRLYEGETVSGSHPQRELAKRLDNTIIPLVDFREANLSDVMKFLEESVAKASPDQKPVKIDAQAVTSPQGEKNPGDDLSSLFGDRDESTPADSPTITLSLRNVSALNALKYITEVANTKYRMEGDKVVIEPDNYIAPERVITRLYPMARPLMDAALIGYRGITNGAAVSVGVLSNYFEDFGVPFPVGASLTYDAHQEKLVVAHTPEYLELFERVLCQLDVSTNDTPREPAGFNPYVETKGDAFSTFSIDVDTASYTLTRQALGEGRLPDPEEVRTEEIVNAFDYDYAAPAAGAFAIHAERAPSPFRAPLELLKIGVQGKLIGRDAKRPAVLTLVIDGSGSMDTADRLGRIRHALRLLAGQLKPQDSIAIVQFSEQPRLALDRTSGTNRSAVLAAVDALAANGSTDLEAGLRLGYEVAAAGFRSGAANRVILLSDGVANLGAGKAEAILARVEQYRKQGIYLTVLGFGRGNYDDAMLEQLANKGDGQYAFVDSDAEAQRLLVDQWEQTLHVIARDVKIQVEFNPDRVTRWRQLGYENRKLKKEDFRNDAVDAGEVGSGQAVTALYDVELTGDAALPIATVRVRCKDPDTGAVAEIEQRVGMADRHADFARAPARFRVAACAAEFAELLRVSPYTAGTDFDAVAAALRPAAVELPLDQRVQELLRLIEAARGLAE